MKTRSIVLILVFCALALGAVTLHAQSSSTIGTDFWFSFAPNYNGVAERITFTAAARTETSVFIEYYAGGTDPNPSNFQQRYIQPNLFVDTIGVISIDLDPSLAEARAPELASYRSVHVTSSAPIALSGYTYNKGSSDGFLALPLSVLGKEYRTANYYTDDTTYRGQFLIVAPFNNTDVTITPKGTTHNKFGDSHVANVPFTITLQRGQSYLVQSGGKPRMLETDLTGTHIESSQPVAVISGHQYTKLGTLSGSTIMEMLPPVEAMSTKYYYASHNTDAKTSVVIVAADTGTFYFNMTSGNSPSYNLSPGQHAEEIINAEAVNIISSGNKRFFAYELKRTDGEVNIEKPHHPTMTLVTSPEWADSTFIYTTPVKFDSASQDYNTTAIYQLRKEAAAKLFPGTIIKYPYSYIPLTFPERAWTTEKSGNALPAARIQRPGSWKIGAMIEGTTGTYSYGHPSSLRLTKRSPDRTKPAAKNITSACGNYQFTVWDSLITYPQSFESGKLSSVRLVTVSNDVTTYPPAQNYRLVADAFSPGEQEYAIKLEVVDPTLNAYGAVFAQDLAGNDTVYEFSYTASKTKLITTGTVGVKIPVGKEFCYTVAITPKNDSLATSPVSIENITLYKGFPDLRISGTTPPLPATFGKDDTLFVTLCTSAKDTNVVIKDSLFIFADCYSRSYSVSGKGITGLLYAENKSYGMQDRGVKVSQQIKLENRGFVPINITDAVFTGSSAFSLDPSCNFKSPIQAKGSLTYMVNYYQTQPNMHDTATIEWKSDLQAPYENSIKTFSILTGATKPQTGVSDVSVFGKIKIISLSPNPSSGAITFHYTSAHNSTLILHDVLGREVYRTSLDAGEHTERITLPQLAAGSYVLRLINADGVARQNIIVE